MGSASKSATYAGKRSATHGEKKPPSILEKVGTAVKSLGKGMAEGAKRVVDLGIEKAPTNNKDMQAKVKANKMAKGTVQAEAAYSNFKKNIKPREDAERANTQRRADNTNFPQTVRVTSGTKKAGYDEVTYQPRKTKKK
jgi:hypothetical protein